MQLTGRFSEKRDFFPFDEYITLKVKKEVVTTIVVRLFVNRNDLLKFKKRGYSIAIPAS